MAELMQADMAKVGVTVEIVSYEWGEYLSRSKEIDRAGAVLLGWTGDNGDPDNFLAVLLGCDGVTRSNRAQWCHEPFDDIIQQAKITSDVAERTRLYEEAQVIFNRQKSRLMLQSVHACMKKLRLSSKKKHLGRPLRTQLCIWPCCQKLLAIKCIHLEATSSTA